MKSSNKRVYGINPAAREIGCGIDWLRDQSDAGNVPCVKDPFRRRFFDDQGIAIAKALYRARVQRTVGRGR